MQKTVKLRKNIRFHILNDNIVINFKTVYFRLHCVPFYIILAKLASCD
jgi:hypothetical protein